MADVKTRGRVPPALAPKPPKPAHKKPFHALLKRLTSLRSTPDPLPSPKPASTKSSRTRASSVSHTDLSSLYPGKPTPAPSRASFSSSHLSSTTNNNNSPPEPSLHPSSATVTTSASSSDFSPAPSIRSLTTITTIHSLAPLYNPHPNHHFNPNAPPVQYTNPMPAPPSTIDAGSGQSTTYSSATANGLLTDNASVITLASSHRRRSFDTDASVRALAPRSLWGGSRESLPLSILSQNLERSERASLYGRALETASLQAVNMGSPPLGSPNRESFLANRKSGAWGELGESSNYSAGYGNGSLYDREDGRSVRSGVGSVRGSLRSRRSRGGLMEEVGSEVKEEEGDVGDGTMVKDGDGKDVKGKGKEVVKDGEK